MESPPRTVFFLVLLLETVLAPGCAENLPPVPPPPPPPPPPPAAVVVAEADGVPHVLRRILAEEKELVATSRYLAAELADKTGRARAESELEAITRELDIVAATLSGWLEGAGDGERLDAAAVKLLELETRISLVHAALRSATSRTTAVEIDTTR